MEKEFLYFLDGNITVPFNEFLYFIDDEFEGVQNVPDQGILKRVLDDGMVEKGFEDYVVPEFV